MLPSFFDSVLQLIVRTSTDLPPDVRAAMKSSLGAEPGGTRSSQALTIIAQNIDLAVDGEGAICQDTGMPTFEVKTPVGANQIWMRQQIRQAVAEATSRGKLRPNSVDSITGENSGDNLGPGTPIIHFDQWERDAIEIKLILKGGGCENTNAQYALPVELPHLGRADRTLDGVRKCILHAVWQAQGKGCAPGAVGVCIGGDRTSGYLHAKEQLFRTLKGMDIRVRPIRHRIAKRVRAHIFLCLLAYYVEWHMRRAMAPLLFDDEELPDSRSTRDAVAPARPSSSAKKKKTTRLTPDGLPIHSFNTLLAALGTRCQNRCRLTADPSVPRDGPVELLGGRAIPNRGPHTRIRVLEPQERDAPASRSRALAARPGA
jgi:tartrate/fumarate subfamily iron-sulfur-dependent hydro-lyase alpha chain